MYFLIRGILNHRALIKAREEALKNKNQAELILLDEKIRQNEEELKAKKDEYTKALNKLNDDK